MYATVRSRRVASSQSVRDQFQCNLCISTWRVSEVWRLNHDRRSTEFARVEQVAAASLTDRIKRKCRCLPAFHQGGLAVAWDTVELIHADDGRQYLAQIVSGPAGDSGSCLRASFGFTKRRVEAGDLKMIAPDDGRRYLWRNPLAAWAETLRIRHHRPASRARLIYLKEEDLFWNLMFACPQVRVSGCWETWRKGSKRFQSQEMHREKLISLGTMAAGLMHELNNPGAAAQECRLAQMRENLSRLQQISLRMCSIRKPCRQEQTECLRALQEKALKPAQASRR